MPTLSTIVVHAARTENRQRQYQFTPKHHGADSSASQWLPSLTLVEEFAVFDSAEHHELSDDRKWLYGVRPFGDSLQYLGTWAQQIAEFPVAPEGQPWHGYPIWAINESAPDGGSGEKMRPAKQVFLKMERCGLLTTRQRKRLYKGDHV